MDHTPLHAQGEILKLSLENIGINLHDLGYGNGFLDMTPKNTSNKRKNR